MKTAPTICWTLGALLACCSLLCTASASGRPNVLLILTEDQGAQTGWLGTKGLQTPRMDSIAARGIGFRNAFVAYPVCSASKAVLYTGLYPHANGCRSVCSNFPPGQPPTAEQMKAPAYQRPRVHEEIPTLIELLHEAGYHTGVSMKLHVVPVHKFPYDEFVTGSGTKFGDHLTIDRNAVGTFIRRAAERNAPWFLCHTISMPHRPFRNSDEEAISVDSADVEVPPFLPDTPVVRKDWAEYLDSIEGADREIGESLAALKDAGCEDNTLVIFLGDHGPAYQRGKMTVYDFGLRVPMAIMGPGVQSGAACDALVSAVDLMPTILEFLQIDIPDRQHGRSLWPTLRGDAEAHAHDCVFAEVHHDYIFFPASPSEAGVQNPGMQERSAFDGRYHLIYRENTDQPRDVNSDLRDWNRWLNRVWDETIAQRDRYPALYEMMREQDPSRLGGRPPRMELYDLKTDPHEMTNIADDPEFRGHRDRMVQLLRRWAQETGDTYISLGR